jgi:hypothetical protein
MHISGPAGEYYAPLGRQVDFPTGRNEVVGGHLYLGGKKFAYIDGACEIKLPTEVPLTVEITKGPRYLPIHETVTLGKGQIALRLSVQPALEPEGGDWVAADARAHFLTPDAAKLESQAEDVHWLNLLATVQHFPSTDGHLYRTAPSLLEFSGQETLLNGIVVNTFNTHPTLGKLALLNCHRPVYPLTSGGDDCDDWSLSDWCGQCHRKKGLVVWSDAFRSDTGLVGGEGLICAILGMVDAIEFDARDRSPPLLPWWYRLLNAGFRIPIVGASGKDSNRIPLGALRTYTPACHSPSRDPKGAVGISGPHAPREDSLHAEREDHYSQWIEHVRAGRTSVSNGPIVHLEMDRARSRVIAKAVSSIPFDRLELVANGEVIAQSNMDESMRSEIVLDKLPPEGGWIAARCHGPKSTIYPLQPVFAHTSAIELPSRHVQPVAGQPAHSRPVAPQPDCLRKAIPPLRRCVEETQTWIEQYGRFENPRSKEQYLRRCELALSELTQRESEAREG